MKEKTVKWMERFSKAMLAPLSYLSAAGMLLALGALLTSESLQGVLPFLGWPPLVLVGQLLYQAMMTIIDHLSLLFCVGIASVIAQKEKQQAALIALMSYLMAIMASNVTLTQLGLLAEPDQIVGLYGTGQTQILGVQAMDMGVFGGILLGFLTGWVFNRTCNKHFQQIALRVYAGTRWSFVCMCGAALLFGVSVCFVWPPIQRGIGLLTGLISRTGHVGMFFYGFLERLLIPTGLHHLVYTPFQFTELGNSLTLGDTTYNGSYIVMMMEYRLGLDFSDGIVWMYTGFTKTFGYLGIAAAFIFCARPENRRRTAAQLLPLAFTATLSGITEPMDFLFCFAAPVLWVTHAGIAGLFIVLLHQFGVKGFTSNLAASVILNLSAGAERTNYPVLYLLGVVEILLYFVVFSFLIKKLDLATPGRERGERAARTHERSAAVLQTAAEKSAEAGRSTQAAAQALVRGLGGKTNIRAVDHCFTRLRLELADPSLIQMAELVSQPQSGILLSGKEMQLVLGLQVQEMFDAVKALMAEENEQIGAPDERHPRRGGRAASLSKQ